MAGADPRPDNRALLHTPLHNCCRGLIFTRTSWRCLFQQLAPLIGSRCIGSVAQGNWPPLQLRFAKQMGVLQPPQFAERVPRRIKRRFLRFGDTPHRQIRPAADSGWRGIADEGRTEGESTERHRQRAPAGGKQHV